MKLGFNVSAIRHSGAYSEHRVKLEELGFNFDSRSFNFECTRGVQWQYQPDNRHHP
jgi:hypothetical protein